MPGISKNVLIVDDDDALRAMIAAYLGDHGFNVSTAADSRRMAELMASSAIDLVLLDLKLPDEDGMNLIRGLRRGSGVPVIILSGHRCDEVDRVVGLELGADDYLIKPFGLRELLARIGAVLRRCEAITTDVAAATAERPARLRFVGWELDLRRRQLTSPDGEPVALTKGEFNLLLAFLRAPQRVLSREQLLGASRVHDDEVFDRSIDVQILRLRRKLEANPVQPALIRTERGVGYVFAASVEAR